MPIKVFLAINAERGHARAIHIKLSKLEEVTSVCTVESGIFDVVAFIDVDSLEDYRLFSIDKVGKLPHVANYTSFITLAE
jgi:DNA-binding Lrp family transcriptional regulator